MKKIILTPLLLLSFISVFAQDLKYELNSKIINPIKKEKLNTAQTISDVVPGYPKSWILGYVSVELSGTCNGKTVLAKGANDQLTAEQKHILNTADLGTNILITIQYKCKNAITEQTELSSMHYKTTYAPDVEAAYVAGQQKMTDYLNEHIITKIPDAISKQMIGVVVKFTVNEMGEINGAKIFKTSGDVKTDALLLEAINNMPKWNPAQNSNGVNVKQDFEFIFGSKLAVGC